MRAWPSSMTTRAMSATSSSRQPPLMLPIGAPSSGTSSRAPGPPIGRTAHGDDGREGHLLSLGGQRLDRLEDVGDLAHTADGTGVDANGVRERVAFSPSSGRGVLHDAGFERRSRARRGTTGGSQDRRRAADRRRGRRARRSDPRGRRSTGSRAGGSWSSCSWGSIFGAGVGALVMGMSSLGNPAPGDEPRN